ncbi:MAG: cobaltochelatase subunit CobN [Cyanobacteria bacterium P01_F01_bin.150]
MHRLAAMPGGWTPGQEGVIFVEQSPAPIIILTAADTDIQSLAVAQAQLPEDFPAVRVVSLLQLQQQLTIDTYADDVLAKATVIVLRLLGGKAYWPYGLEVVKEIVQQTHATLFVLPGDTQPDPTLISHSTAKITDVNQLWHYFVEGGIDNMISALQFIADTCLGSYYQPSPAVTIPKVGRYGQKDKDAQGSRGAGERGSRGAGEWGSRGAGEQGSRGAGEQGSRGAREAQAKVQNPKPVLSLSNASKIQNQPTPNPSREGNRSGPTSQYLNVPTPQRPNTSTPQLLNSLTPQLPNSLPKSKTQNLKSKITRVGILFYRSHYLSGNLAPIDALCDALRDRHLTPVPLFVSSLRDAEVQAEILTTFRPDNESVIAVLLNTTSFSAAKLDGAALDVSLWRSLNVPVLQVILSGGTQEQWQDSWQGLSPRDIAMNVALPEVDGRIISRAVSFKSVQTRNAALETDVVTYRPVGDRIQFVADLAQSWVTLAQTPPQERRIALVLANYPNRDGRIANGVGLDTPESCVRMLQALQQSGYNLGPTEPIDNQEQATNKCKSAPKAAMGYASLTHPTGENPAKGDIPVNGDELIQLLTKGVTNDPEARELRPVAQSLSLEDYQVYFDSLPEAVQQGVCDRWGGIKAEGRRMKAEIKAEGRRMKDEEPAPSPSQEGDRSGPTPQLPNSPTPQLPSQNPKPVLSLSNASKIQNLKSKIPIPGFQLGNIFIGIQPSRGYDRDPSLNYHAPDLEPTHDYLAFYQWLRRDFGANAIVHVGKHGNLEWLPGKGIALTQDCYPEIALGPLPHLYPFIVNDPGEGAQAKRRSQAVIIDHLTPPMTRAELYGPLQQLESLVDEYYEAQTLDPTRLPIVGEKIVGLLQETHLRQDLRLAEPDVDTNKTNSNDDDELQAWLPKIDGYLCELKEAQIRDGLHIFGSPPQQRQARDLIIAIARHPNAHHIGLSRAIAQVWNLDIDPLTADFAQPYANAKKSEIRGCRNVGDVIERIENHAEKLIDALLGHSSWPEQNLVVSNSPECSPAKVSSGPPSWQGRVRGGAPTADILPGGCTEPLETVLEWISNKLIPALNQTTDEIDYLLNGLDGGYVPSGASGAPTRGRTEVLPTGRNFYSVDIRAIPTESAWDVGRKAAETLIERYTQDHGDYPKTLGLSIWGTSTMRTGGDDLAEALALLGVQPVWDGPSRRVVDFEILPVAVLGRPRVDVTLRISGFFRDAFANLIDLFHRAVEAVAALDESPEDNPLAAQVTQDQRQWQEQGVTEEQAEARSRYRVFGSKPGAYGAGLQGLIEAQNWTSEDDLARAYINWSSYAYTGQGDGKSAPGAFDQRLQRMEVVLQNQDNREHDLLDSDDYYQFQGGLTAAVRSRRGTAPTTYFGDHSIPERPRVRHLKEEIARVYRSRVVNPKWIGGVMRHGYKGAFEMAATVDYLFAYDATTHCAEDHMYEGVANAYLLDDAVQKFVREKNPWALRDMSERLLEANQRGLWKGADQVLIDELRSLVHEAEAIVESHTDPLSQ